jgi:hypothetical protein
MKTSHKVKNLKVDLNLSELSIDGRVARTSLIEDAAPQSAMYAANPAVKDAADKTINSGKALKLTAAAVQNAELKVTMAKADLAEAELQLEKDMLCFKSVAEANCKTEAELNELGFNRRAPKAAPAPLTPPDSILAKPGKEKGSMIVQAKRAGRSFGGYIAEISAEPVGPGTWQLIPGTGARRVLSGHVSGAQYWVRFRAVSATEQSAWSAAVPAVAR